MNPISNYAQKVTCIIGRIIYVRFVTQGIQKREWMYKSFLQRCFQVCYIQPTYTGAAVFPHAERWRQ